MPTRVYVHQASIRPQAVMALAPCPSVVGACTRQRQLRPVAVEVWGMCRMGVDVLADGPVLDVQVSDLTSTQISSSDGRTLVCQTADACTISLSQYVNSSNSLGTPGLDTTMTCSASPFVYSSAQLSCSVVQPTVQALFPGDTTLTITRTLNSSLTPGGQTALTQAGLTGGEAVAYAQLWLDGVEQFYCRASGCVQTAGDGGNGSTWDCTTLDCTCRPGAAFCGGGQVGLVRSLQTGGLIAEPVGGPEPSDSNQRAGRTVDGRVPRVDMRLQAESPCHFIRRRRSIPLVLHPRRVRTAICH